MNEYLPYITAIGLTATLGIVLASRGETFQRNKKKPRDWLDRIHKTCVGVFLLTVFLIEAAKFVWSLVNGF